MDNIADLLVQLDDRLSRIETMLGDNDPLDKQEWFSVNEVAKLVGKAPFTVRKWCRENRINALKRECGRGRTEEWMVSKAELKRYREKGLLPLGL